MARERRNYARMWYTYRSPERKAQDDFYDNIQRFAGEILTIERFVIKTTAISMRTITVRYDENTAFELNLYHHDLLKLTKAGYELPQTIGEHPFHAEVIFKWQAVLRDNRLVIDTVLPKAEIAEPTPLQAQSAIYWLLKHDSHLQKLVRSVEMHHDLHGSPIVRIQVPEAHKVAVEHVVNPMADGKVALLWSIIPRKRFVGTFDTTENLPALDTIDPAA